MKLQEEDFKKLSELYNNLVMAEQKLGRMAAKKALLEAKARMLNPQLFEAIDDIGRNTSVLSQKLLKVSDDIRNLNAMLKAKYEIEGEFSVDMSTGEMKVEVTDTPIENPE